MKVDMVLAWIRPERYPKCAYKELHSIEIGPYKIFMKSSLNIYVLDLCNCMGMSNVFDFIPW